MPNSRSIPLNHRRKATFLAVEVFRKNPEKSFKIFYFEVKSFQENEKQPTVKLQAVVLECVIMKNMFSVGTDNFKFKVQRGNNTDSYNMLKSLAVNFPFIKEPLGLDEATNTEKNFITKIRNMDISALLDYAIKSCEAYLLPEKAIISYSYPQEMTEDDANNLLPVCLFDADSRRFHIYPVNRFYQPVRLWLIMSALYFESLKDYDCQLEDKLKQLHFSEKESIDLYSDLHNKTTNRKLKRNKRVSELCYNNPLDSYYEVMVVNGLLSNEFHADGSIPTAQTKNDPDKYDDRLPEKTIPSFAWEQKHNIDYDSQDLDFQLITQYLMEKTTGANLAHYREYVKTFMHDLKDHYNESKNSIPDSVFDFLSIYPLLHFRLEIMYYLLEAGRESEEETMLTKKEWLKFADDMMYQAFVYFPLLDSLFHVLLKIKYGKRSYHTGLCNELENVYESGPLYQKSNIFLGYADNPGVHYKSFTIELSNGRKFPVEYKRFLPDFKIVNSKRRIIATKVNYKNPRFVNCLKAAFISDYEKIKDVPEKLFMSFIKDITNECDGFVLSNDYFGHNINPDIYASIISKKMKTKEEFKRNNEETDKIYESFYTNYENCMKKSFTGYESIIKQIPVKRFEDFIAEVIRIFDTDSYGYLFQHNGKGFSPIYWVRRNVDYGLYGLRLEELEKELGKLSYKVHDLCYKDYDDAAESVHFQHPLCAKLDDCLRNARSLIIRNSRYFGKVVAFLQKFFIKKFNHELASDKKLRNKLPKEFSQIKNQYKELQEKFVSEIDSICKIYNSIPNDDVYNKKRAVREKSEHKELKKSVLMSMIDYMGSVKDFFDSIQEYLQDVKVLNGKLNKIVAVHMHFDVSNLCKGETEFYDELKKILGPLEDIDMKNYNIDFIKEAQIFNSYDMVQLMKAIEYYSYLNSDYMRDFHDLESVISRLKDDSDNLKNYRSNDNYKQFINQLKKRVGIYNPYLY